MNKLLASVRKSVLEIKPYHMADTKYRIKLNQNESPYDLPADLKKELLAEFGEIAWNRYPSFITVDLCKKLAAKDGVSEGMILVGNGSNELLQLICSIILEPGKKFMTIQPTFALYEQIARVFGADFLQLELEDDFSFPVKKILEMNMEEDIPLQVYCTPNNPTGSILTLNEIEAILKLASGIVVIDEAYFDFSKITSVELLKEYPNLVITRTFSKACGLAGFRIGYLIGSPEVVREVYKAKLPYNLDIFSEFAASKILAHPNIIQERVADILAQRDWLIQELKQIPGVMVFPTHSNFFLISTPIEPVKLFNILLEEDGILLRNVSKNHPRLENVLRVSVGTKEENQKLVAAFKRIFEKE